MLFGRGGVDKEVGGLAQERAGRGRQRSWRIGGEKEGAYPNRELGGARTWRLGQRMLRTKARSIVRRLREEVAVE